VSRRERRPVPARSIATLIAWASCAVAGIAQVTQDAPARRPDAIVDLSTDSGTALVHGTWKYADARIVEVDHRGPGPDLKPSGAPTRTHDIEPHAGEAAFNDASWTTVAPATLTARRGTGRLSFGWYRINVTVPERIGAFDAAGSTAILEVVVDDYAEIWVNGQLPQVLGQAGGQLVRGWNAPNRVVLGRNLRPGQQFQIAIFGANGPLSDPPVNFIWVRSATLDFYSSGAPGAGTPVDTLVDRKDPALDRVLEPGTRIEKLASGFTFTEGPVWHPDGYLLFSDPNDNVIYRRTTDGQVSVFRTKSGYTGVDVGKYKQPGSNGLAIDPDGRLTIDEHGNRRVTRLEKNGVITVLADRFEGRRFNSPNDLVYRSDGSLYFTDPPFGLPKAFDDPRKELSFSGIYRYADGTVHLLARDLTGPNGIAFSPDERFLYVGNWDEKRKVVMRYDVRADGSIGPGSVFYDMTTAPGEDAIDGVKVDREGNVYVSGPGGLWVLSADGKHLGTIRGPEHPHNMAWGDDDYRTLYLAAQTGLYRIRLKVPGAGAPRQGGTR
jgi:gluconolactonase